MDSSTNIVENEASHQYQLSNLGNDDQRTSEVLAQVAPSTVQLLPAASPEEQVQELGNGHAEDEVGNESINFTGLRIIPNQTS